MLEESTNHPSDPPPPPYPINAAKKRPNTDLNEHISPVKAEFREHKLSKATSYLVRIPRPFSNKKYAF